MAAEIVKKPETQDERLHALEAAIAINEKQMQQKMALEVSLREREIPRLRVSLSKQIGQRDLLRVQIEQAKLARIGGA